MKVSAVILARNEEHNIRYCLETVRWCDEIVVVDMESSDRTREIASEFTSRIFSHPKILAFDIAKKFAVEQAHGQWILLIDADEMIPVSLSIKLQQIAYEDLEDVVFMPFKTYIMGEWIRNTGWWPDYHARFFKREAMNISGDIHNFLTPCPKSKICYLSATYDNAVSHFNYRDSSHFMDKLNRYTTIEASSLYDKHENFSFLTLAWRSIKEFVLRYIYRSGYRDGFRGFVLSLLMVVYRLMIYVKLWELHERVKSTDFDYTSIRASLINEYTRDTK
jgi:glycosyltransferase involved in cell wall biosynthesis